MIVAKYDAGDFWGGVDSEEKFRGMHYPDWVKTARDANAEIIELDDFGYEVFRVEKDGQVYGWFWDDNTGYEFAEGDDPPDPYDDDSIAMYRDEIRDHYHRLP